jgi:hypothetical protein
MTSVLSGVALMFSLQSPRAAPYPDDDRPHIGAHIDLAGGTPGNRATVGSGKFRAFEVSRL